VVSKPKIPKHNKKTIETNQKQWAILAVALLVQGHQQ
jgi:hypothetical protein